MKLNKRKENFEVHFHYWVVHLKLDKKYRFVLKKDNRIDCYAMIEWMEKNIYLVRYNTLQLNTEYKIVGTILHEIGHLFDKNRNAVNSEANAEYFSLKILKKEKPKLYVKCVKWTKDSMNSKEIDDVHREGYRIALTKLGEI